MKKLILLFLPFLLTSLGCARLLPKAMVTLHVVNQDGEPVSDTEIVATFEGGSEDDIIKYPDKNGYVTFTSPVYGCALFDNKTYQSIYNPTRIDKYYPTCIERIYSTARWQIQDGKWMPWNPTIEFVLFERINPIPMYALGRQEPIFIPARNKWVGFDMMKNEWMPPYGVGKHADIEVLHAWNGKDIPEYTGSTLTLRFPDKDAGFYTFTYEHREPEYDTWRFRSPYHADPKKTYTKDVRFFEKYNPQKKVWESRFIPDDTGYIFRTRTRFDDQGRLIGAHYGKIYQPYPPMLLLWYGKVKFRLPFYLNPTENDTNLECDSKRNLLKRHPWSEDVAP